LICAVLRKVLDVMVLTMLIGNFFQYTPKYKKIYKEKYKRIYKNRSYYQSGFTMVVVLLALFLLSLTAQGVLFLVSQEALREKLRMHQRYVKLYNVAIQQYYTATPGTRKEYPKALSDLLEDTRHLTKKRYIRRLYQNPLSQLSRTDILQSLSMSDDPQFKLRLNQAGQIEKVIDESTFFPH
jgi:type II secretory pathway pseudopilin PulG